MKERVLGLQAASIQDDELVWKDSYGLKEYNPRYLNNLYASGVGKVLQTYFYLHSPVISEKRLIRYHLSHED